ncbi:predicted protein [Naegleria gruberi]|uniref:Predicted protein n=1 Tax=Naegleria gruberi TaxID=5762 RepID=D2UZW8_NAEGR|nr:uncharacterized protein NAEGRDRAFT_62089 [Naegleria gruberi]EFC50005.1 predicted protein [Naegleria gruberi]|eukprot:XP_002682749.1 predicted protein [Naegleria gruberi strain NEG-M]
MAPNHHVNNNNKGILPLQPNRRRKQRLFNESDGRLQGATNPILSLTTINSDIGMKIDSERNQHLANISLNSVCESLNIPMAMVGRFLRPEEARTFVSCNICAHRLNVLWASMMNMMANLYTSTMIVQENSFDIPRMYPTISPLVYISPSIVLCKLSAKQLYKQIVETTFQIDQTLERLNEDKKAMTTFEETNHFLISQLVRYCVELERGSTLNQNMKTVLIKEREFISHFQKMIIKRLNFILYGLDLKSIGIKLSNTDILDFSSSIFDVSKIFDIEIIPEKPKVGKVDSSGKNQDLELSNSSDGSGKSAILITSNSHREELNDDDNQKQCTEKDSLSGFIQTTTSDTTTISNIQNNLNNAKKNTDFSVETVEERGVTLTPSSPPVNIPTSSLSQPKTTPIPKSDCNSHFRDDDIPFTEISNFVQEDAAILMKSAASATTPIIKKPSSNPKKSILKQSKTIPKRPPSPLIDGYDSEEEPLISVHTSTFSSLNNKDHENVLNSDSDDMSDDLSTYSDITRNIGMHKDYNPTKKQKL